MPETDGMPIADFSSMTLGNRMAMGWTWLFLAALAGCNGGKVVTSRAALDTGQCESANGQTILDPGDGSTLRNGCPDGRRLLGAVDVGAEGALCCEIPRHFTLDECQAIPSAHVIGDPGDGSVHRAGCPFPQQFLGVVDFGAEGGICCRTLEYTTIASCQAQGGRVIVDPGDGRSYRDGCPAGEQLVSAVDIGAEGGVCCVAE